MGLWDNLNVCNHHCKRLTRESREQATSRVICLYLMMPHIFGRSLGVPPSRVFRRKRNQKRGKKNQTGRESRLTCLWEVRREGIQSNSCLGLALAWGYCLLWLGSGNVQNSHSATLLSHSTNFIPPKHKQNPGRRRTRFAKQITACSFSLAGMSWQEIMPQREVFFPFFPGAQT